MTSSCSPTRAAGRGRSGWPGWWRRCGKSENVVAGVTEDLCGKGRYELTPDLEKARELKEADYLRESPTLNFAFRREVFDAVGDFDESFTYGSDIDFCWRLNDIGYRIRRVPDAVVSARLGNAAPPAASFLPVRQGPRPTVSQAQGAAQVHAPR